MGISLPLNALSALRGSEIPRSVSKTVMDCLRVSLKKKTRFEPVEDGNFASGSNFNFSKKISTIETSSFCKYLSISHSQRFHLTMSHPDRPNPNDRLYCRSVCSPESCFDSKETKDQSSINRYRLIARSSVARLAVIAALVAVRRTHFTMSAIASSIGKCDFLNVEGIHW